MEKQQKIALSCYPQITREVPDFEERDTNKAPYVYYGKDNRFPHYLWNSLYLKSATLQSIINGTIDYVVGNGLTSDLLEVNTKGDTLEDLVKQLVSDYMIFGGFALQVIYNKVGEVNEVYWLDFQKLRSNRDNTVFYYAEDWVKKPNDYVEYEAFDPDKRKGTSVFYFKGHLTRGVYPIPRYIGALAAVETSTEISKFHLNSILNNFSASAIINFNNGVPDEETQREIERKVNDKFGSAGNAGKTMITFNDSKESAVTVERLASDDFDERYKSLATDTMKQIFVAFRAVPQLFGYTLENKGFSKTEFLEAFELYNKTVVKSIQNDVKRALKKVFNADIIEFIPFSLDTPSL